MKALKRNYPDLSGIEGAWKGQRCFVVGGGYSLTGFDFDALQGENVIATNKSLLNVPFAQYWISMDSRFYIWLKQGSLGWDLVDLWNDFKGRRLYLDTNGYPFENDIELIKCAGTFGFPESFKKGLFSGGNTGFTGLQLAIMLGADPIILLGYDMAHYCIDKHHHHRDYPQKQSNDVFQKYIPAFNGIAPILRHRGIEVINVNDEQQCGLQCFKFGELKIKKKRPFIVVSFYTKGSQYETDAARLRESMEKFGIEYDVEGIDQELKTRSDWKNNTHYKPEFILQMLEKHPGKTIAWLDADAEVVASPDIFGTFSSDVAAHFRPKSNGEVELLSGTILFSNTGKSKAVLKKWIDRNKLNRSTDKSEQQNLQIVLNTIRGIDVAELPHSYVSFDIYPDINPVIVHHQASRRYRGK